MAKTKPVSNRAATLTIKSPGKMTPKGRKDIAAWLRQCADSLIKHGNDYTAGKFTSGFNYIPR